MPVAVGALILLLLYIANALRVINANLVKINQSMITGFVGLSKGQPMSERKS